MESTEHKGKSLLYLTVEPDGYDPQVEYPLVIILHGFGANMHDLAGLCPSIERRGYLYACPNAPMPFQFGPGMTGYGWTPPRGEGTAEDARRAVELLESFFEEVLEQYRVPPGRIILMGFSQGGGMTYRCGLGRSDVFAGLAALSSTMPDREELLSYSENRARNPASLDLPTAQATAGGKEQPIFIAHGTNDELVPVERAREARELLEVLGYSPQYREYPMGHEISQGVLDDLVTWIKGVLPPATS